ncbi:hypothetical protein QA634_12240 [Methylobacterium sp. CB376]|uniref:hypothetical protein n=1 Tax=Methylobacterium sp. CB376 TaxID=3138063 RepID=UPI0024B0DE7B|nr:hypothetical protein [Methylobacterium nodulans]WFT82564.1 hypothetical protein QA634_12240 [Methylobacterium nodulans]
MRQAVPLAVQACAPRIEREAPRDFDWLSRPVGSIFQQAVPPPERSTVAHFRGDSIRFLDPQGQWVRVTYDCEFDTATRTARGVKVRLGRLDGRGAAPAAGRRSAEPPAPPSPPPQAEAEPRKPVRLKPREPSAIEIEQVVPSGSAR